MAWAGTGTWQVFENYFIYTANGFDADAETTGILHIANRAGYLPSSYTMMVRRLAGATDVVDVDLNLYMPDNITYETHLTCTNSAANNAAAIAHTTVDYTNAAGYLNANNFIDFAILVNTVGAGNQLEVTIIGRR